MSEHSADSRVHSSSSSLPHSLSPSLPHSQNTRTSIQTISGQKPETTFITTAPLPLPLDSRRAQMTTKSTYHIRRSNSCVLVRQLVTLSCMHLRSHGQDQYHSSIQPSTRSPTLSLTLQNTRASVQANDHAQNRDHPSIRRLVPPLSLSLSLSKTPARRYRQSLPPSHSLIPTLRRLLTPADPWPNHRKFHSHRPKSE